MIVLFHGDGGRRSGYELSRLPARGSWLKDGLFVPEAQIFGRAETHADATAIVLKHMETCAPCSRPFAVPIGILKR